MQHILGAFQPDEYAMDAISSEILKTLQEDEARYGGQRPALTDLSAGYRPPLEEYLLQKVRVGPGVWGKEWRTWCCGQGLCNGHA